MGARLSRAAGQPAGRPERRRGISRGARLRAAPLDPALDELLASLPLAALVLDRRAHVLFWNEAAKRLFGWSAHEVLGQPQPLVPPGEFPALQAGIERDFARLQRSEFTAQRRRKDGAPVWVRVYACPLRDRRGSVIGMIRMFVDLTESRAAEDALRRSLAQRDIAVENERTRIARELHDELGQALTALKMELAWLAPRLPGAADVGGKLEEMQKLLEDTMRSLRRLTSELRPALLDVADLFGAIALQAQAFERRTGIACRVDLPEQAFDPGRERTTAVFRVLQETLTNVSRHAAASEVRVRLRRAAGRMILEVEDDGRGFDPRDVRADAYGLVGMRERAELLGGELRVAARSRRGTRVRLTMPLA